MTGAEELKELMRKARAAYEQLSPEEKRAMRREQRISWVYGQMGLSGRKITREEAARIVDEYDNRG